jgi:hypothetical protein
LREDASDLEVFQIPMDTSFAYQQNFVEAQRQQPSGKQLSFGKHRGKTFEEIVSTDISYCNWALKQTETRGVMKEFQEWLRLRAKKVSCEACNGSGHGFAM